MKTNLPGISLNGIQVSDLFFNSPLENYNAVDRGNSPDTIRQREEIALFQDAIAFSEMTGAQIAPGLLVNNFLERL